MGSDRSERVRSFYGDATYERLVAAKDRWDPGNVFCHNQNIRPSAPEAATRRSPATAPAEARG